jgi:DNA-binding response OmpR family regulator
MRMLVVEDEADTVKFLKAGFEAEGFSVDSAANGSQGSFMARTNPYDVVILDNLLPGKQGLQICREIRAHGKTMPVIVLSGVAETSTKVSLLDTGADDYVTKPYSFGELLSRVRAVLRRPPRFTGRVLTVSDLVFNTETREATRAGLVLDLSGKELGLLEYLMKHAGQALSHAQILESVWDMHGDPFSNTVETHVFRLRKKLEAGGLPRLIHTMPGRGYKIG